MGAPTLPVGSPVHPKSPAQRERERESEKDGGKGWSDDGLPGGFENCVRGCYGGANIEKATPYLQLILVQKERSQKEETCGEARRQGATEAVL